MHCCCVNNCDKFTHTHTHLTHCPFRFGPSAVFVASAPEELSTVVNKIKSRCRGERTDGSDLMKAGLPINAGSTPTA